MFLFTITNVAIAMVVALLQVLTWTTPFKAGAFAIVAQEWNLNNPGRPCGEHDLRLIKTRTGDILGDDQRQLEDVVPGISPIDVIVNSVAIMLILDLDEKVFNMTKGMFYESYHTLCSTTSSSVVANTTSWWTWGPQSLDFWPGGRCGSME